MRVREGEERPTTRERERGRGEADDARELEGEERPTMREREAEEMTTTRETEGE